MPGERTNREQARRIDREDAEVIIATAKHHGNVPHPQGMIRIMEDYIALLDDHEIVMQYLNNNADVPWVQHCLRRLVERSSR